MPTLPAVSKSLYSWWKQAGYWPQSLKQVGSKYTGLKGSEFGDMSQSSSQPSPPAGRPHMGSFISLRLFSWLWRVEGEERDSSVSILWVLIPSSESKVNRGILGSNGTKKAEDPCESEEGGGEVIVEMSDKVISQWIESDRHNKIKGTHGSPDPGICRSPLSYVLLMNLKFIWNEIHGILTSS